MTPSLLRGVFDGTAFAVLGRRILSWGNVPPKFGLRLQLTSGNPEVVEACGSAHVAFWTSTIPDRYREVTGHNPLLLFHNCTFRHQTTAVSPNYVGWHLDANFYGFEVPLWTVWAPFVPVGTDAAGLEFSVSRSPVDRRPDIRRFWNQLRPDAAGRVEIADPVLPVFHGTPDHKVVSGSLAPGDAFVFDQYALHRTQRLPGATRERLAIEYRIVSRDRAPSDIELAEKRDFLVSYRDGDAVNIVPLKDVFAI